MVAYCSVCGRPVDPDARFCGACGASVGSPPSPPPGPPPVPAGSTGPGASRWALIAAAVLGAVALVALAFWLGTRSGSGGTPAASASPSASATASASVTESKPTQSPSVAPTSSPPAPTPTDTYAQGWIGYEFRGDQEPAPRAGVTQVSGALLGVEDRAVSLVSTPQGLQYWYLELLGYDRDVPYWKVLDAVAARGDPIRDQFVLGATPCVVDGVERTEVVASFVAEDAPELSQMIDGYTVDLGTDRLYPLEVSATCVNESYGV